MHKYFTSIRIRPQTASEAAGLVAGCNAMHAAGYSLQPKVTVTEAVLEKLEIRIIDKDGA